MCNFHKHLVMQLNCVLFTNRLDIFYGTDRLQSLKYHHDELDNDKFCKQYHEFSLILLSIMQSQTLFFINSFLFTIEVYNKRCNPHSRIVCSFSSQGLPIEVKIYIFIMSKLMHKSRVTQNLVQAIIQEGSKMGNYLQCFVVSETRQIDR